MKLLIDECLPRALKQLFGEHECRIVQEMGWSGKKNGALLLLAELEFDVLVTIDQRLEDERELANRSIALLVFAARSNQIEDLAPLIPAALGALLNIQPGRAIRIPQ